MASLSQVRNLVDNWLTARWPIIVSRQDTFFANKGRYWQGLLTHLTLPVYTNVTDGASIGNNMLVETTDNKESWQQLFPELLAVNLPAAVRCDVYNGPAGHGYAVTVYIRFNSTIYSRTENVGPEMYRTQTWQVMEEEEWH